MDNNPDIVDALDHPALSVKASIPRRHRAGLAFGSLPTVVPAGTLTREQMEAILADPYLAVAEVKPAEPATSDPADKGGGKGKSGGKPKS